LAEENVKDTNSRLRALHQGEDGRLSGGGERGEGDKVLHNSESYGVKGKFPSKSGTNRPPPCGQKENAATQGGGGGRRGGVKTTKGPRLKKRGHNYHKKLRSNGKFRQEPKGKKGGWVPIVWPIDIRKQTKRGKRRGKERDRGGGKKVRWNLKTVGREWGKAEENGRQVSWVSFQQKNKKKRGGKRKEEKTSKGRPRETRL